MWGFMSLLGRRTDTGVDTEDTDTTAGELKRENLSRMQGRENLSHKVGASTQFRTLNKALIIQASHFLFISVQSIGLS